MMAIPPQCCLMTFLPRSGLPKLPSGRLPLSLRGGPHLMASVGAYQVASRGTSLDMGTDEAVGGHHTALRAAVG